MILHELYLIKIKDIILSLSRESRTSTRRRGTKARIVSTVLETSEKPFSWRSVTLESGDLLFRSIKMVQIPR